MSRRITIKLRMHRASGRLYKTIGMALGKDGQPKKKVFYFDPGDDAGAIQKVLELKARWKRLTAEGKMVWDQDSDFRQQHADDATIFMESTAKPLTVADAATLYVEQLRRHFLGGQISQCHFESQCSRLKQALRPLAALPLSVVREQQLQSAVLRLAQRPMMELHRPASKKGKPQTEPKKTRRMSATYASSVMNTLKWFWIWCDESDLVEWRKPSLFRAIFKAKPVLTIEERQRELGGEEVDHFTVDELAKLWNEASSLQRTLLLLGLNCAFANAECATLRGDEVKGLKTDQPFIERFRQKTMKTAGKGSYGKWYLWSETLTQLEQNRASENAARLWLLTEKGQSLSFHNAIGQGWRRLVRRAGVRPLGFKYLRKTAAHIVRNTLGYGKEVADMMLSHVDGGMVRHYAGRDWDGKLKEATQGCATTFHRCSCYPPSSEGYAVLVWLTSVEVGA